MKSRSQTIVDIHVFLQRAGFAVSDPKDLVHAGFDLVARRDLVIIVIKVMANANSLSGDMLAGMKTLAHAVAGSPILVALKSGAEPIEDGVVYTRSGIPMVSFGTLKDLIEEGIPPMVYTAGGGFYVEVDSEVLRKAREGGMSLGDLAEMAGVSRRTIRMYEDGMNAKLDVALRLEKGLSTELIAPLNPLVCSNIQSGPEPPEVVGELARDIFRKLVLIGYSVEPSARCPFDAVTHDKNVVLFTGIDRKRPGLDRRAKAIATLSRILEKHAVIFVDRLGEKLNLEGAPLICTEELRCAKDKKKVMDLIEERL